MPSLLRSLRQAHGARWSHLERRAVQAVADAIQHQGLQRRGDANESSDNGCDENPEDSHCEKPAGATGPLPVILGALIPILIACIVLWWLHHRHMQRLRREEQQDKTKSMDFGLDVPSATRRGPGEKTGKGRAGHQLSLDMSSPYLMPEVTPASRDSFSTLARTYTGDDRYGRPSTSGSSVAPPPKSHSARPRERDYAPSDYSEGPDSSNADLLGGASRMGISTPPRPLTPQSATTGPTVPQIAIVPSRSSDRTPQMGLPASPRDGTFAKGKPQGFEEPRDEPPASLSTAPSSVVQPTPLKPAQQPPSMPEIDNGPSFQFSIADDDDEDDKPEEKPAETNRKSLAPGAFENRRISMGFRPLPPENPDDTAEERAMRIRSFYKEYFASDESEAPAMPAIPAAYYGNQQDYSQEHGMHPDEVPVFNAETGGFVIPGAKPFAEAPTRRAMTPPPRMPPRFHGPPGPGSRAGSAAGHRFMPPEQRSYSSAGGPKPRRPIEPPAPLAVLPTPSLVKEDAFASPIMFAPHVRGEQEEPRGGLRPYSPNVPAFSPLASSFDDMALLPTPHMLRKSGTFTALDFAPPQKFGRGDGIGSDAGSIRSDRSGAHAAMIHAQNVRAGAYRVSRIPTNVVPLKMEMDLELRPTWDVRHKV